MMGTLCTVLLLFAVTVAAEQKINIAVLDLEARGGLLAEEVATISDRLRGELISTGTFSVFERGQMNAILQEQGFQLSGACSDASCIVEVGQLLAVHKMVGGSIGKVGRMYSINVRIIDIQTGRIDAQIAEDVQSSKEALLTVHIRNVARDVAGLPRIESGSPRPWIIPVGVAVAGGAGVLAYLLVNRGAEGGDGTPASRTLQLEVPIE